MGRVEWVHHLQPEDKSEEYNPQDGTEETSSTSLLGMFESGPNEIKSSDNVLFWKPKMVLEEMVPEHDLLTKMETTELYELGVWDMWYVLTVSALGKGGWRLRAQGQHGLRKSSKQPPKQLNK